MTKNKTTIVTMTGYADYARIFNENMDDNMEFHEKTQGQFNMNFYPETEADFDKYFEAGAPTSTMGHDAIKLGREEIGMGKFLKLKRPNKHPSGIEDFGGAPAVYDMRDGDKTKRWDFEADGEVGNGSKVTVKVSIFGSGPRASIRLEKVAVLEHIPFDGAAKEDAF